MRASESWKLVAPCALRRAALRRGRHCQGCKPRQQQATTPDAPPYSPVLTLPPCTHLTRLPPPACLCAKAIGGAIEWLLQSNRYLLSSPDLLASTLARILSYHAASGVQRVTTATSPVRVRTLEGSIATLSSAK